MSYDVAIVGGGIAGLGAAYRLAPDHRVLVVDADAIGGGTATSSRASGVVTTPVDYPDMPAWSRHALDFFRDLDGTGVFDWTDRPYVRGVRPDERDRAERLAAGEGVDLVDVEEAAGRVRAAAGGDGPDRLFDPGVPYERALVWSDTGYVDREAFLATLRRECRRRGVELRPDTAVESIRVSGGAAVGLDTEYGAVSADAVVVAAGSGTRPLLADVLPLPLARFTWNVAYLDADLPPGYPMGGDPTVAAYWRGTDGGRLLVGVEHQYGDDPPADEGEIGDRIRRVATAVLPGLLAVVGPDPGVVRYESCPTADATTPDARAIVDAPAEGPDDLVVAAGFHGAGLMATGSVGTAVRALVTGAEPPFPLAPFALDRFETRDPDFPFVSLFGG